MLFIYTQNNSYVPKQSPGFVRNSQTGGQNDASADRAKVVLSVFIQSKTCQTKTHMQETWKKVQNTRTHSDKKHCDAAHSEDKTNW